MFLDKFPHQFEFQKGHRTDMDIYVLKEFIEFYEGQNTSVFVTFLHSSKAYDKLIVGRCLTNEVKQGNILSPALFNVYIFIHTK